MHFSQALIGFFVTGALCAAQVPTHSSPTPAPAHPAPVQGAQASAPLAPAAAPAAPAGPAPSSLVRPAVATLDQVVSGIRFDRWKRGDIRDQASSDSSSISRNIHQTLPALLDAADQAPDSNARLVPAFTNIDALYDVLLRIFSAARVAGQPEDVGRLQLSLTQLGDARRALSDRMRSQAETHEKLIVTLRASNQQLQAYKNAPPPPPAPCVPPPAHRPRKKPSAAPTKPATTQKPAAAQAQKPAAGSTTPQPH